MSTLSTANIQSKAANTPPVIKDLNGTECGTFCRAWVSFNGQGTLAIRGSFNVSSITDNNVGDYTINLATAMPDQNGAIATSKANTVSNNGNAIGTLFQSTSTVSMVVYEDGTKRDSDYVYLSVFR